MTAETPPMTTDDHIREAERFAASAEKWMDADPPEMGSQERIARRSVDLQAAQVHATLAQTLRAAEMLPLMAKVAAWAEEPGAPAVPAPKP